MHAILAKLLDSFPTKRDCTPEGWPETFAHRLEPSVMIDMRPLIPESTDDSNALLPFINELMAKSLGDESGPGAFDSEAGREFIRTMPIGARNHITTILLEVTEALGPSEARKKKSSTPESEVSST